MEISLPPCTLIRTPGGDFENGGFDGFLAFTP